jgi:hypothetical protein
VVLSVVFEETTTFDEYKCLNRSRLRYTTPTCQRR